MKEASVSAEKNSPITAKLARERRTQFITYKLPYIWQHPDGVNQKLAIEYSFAAYMTIIEGIANSTDITKLSGLKIYFAVFEERLGDDLDTIIHNMLYQPADPKSITLIFAPTRFHNNIYYNDVGTYYVFDKTGNCLLPLDIDDARRWVQKYQFVDPSSNQKHGLHHTLAKKDQHGYDLETKSCWYSKDSLYAAYTDIMSEHTRSSKIIISFGAYKDVEEKGDRTVDTGPGKYEMKPEETNRQLTLIFSTNDHNGEKFIKKEEDYDTGAPCPPATCGGDGL